jgi:hypothetical protein
MLLPHSRARKSQPLSMTTVFLDPCTTISLLSLANFLLSRHFQIQDPIPLILSPVILRLSV